MRVPSEVVPLLGLISCGVYGGFLFALKKLNTSKITTFVSFDPEDPRFQ